MKRVFGCLVAVGLCVLLFAGRESGGGGGPQGASGSDCVVNADPRDPKHKGDRGVLLCLNERDGSLLWQLIVPKRWEDPFFDWPKTGICSSVSVEGCADVPSLRIVTTAPGILAPVGSRTLPMIEPNVD